MTAKSNKIIFNLFIIVLALGLLFLHWNSTYNTANGFFSSILSEFNPEDAAFSFYGKINWSTSAKNNQLNLIREAQSSLNESSLRVFMDSYEMFLGNSVLGSSIIYALGQAALLLLIKWIRKALQIEERALLDGPVAFVTDTIVSILLYTISIRILSRWVQWLYSFVFCLLLKLDILVLASDHLLLWIVYWWFTFSIKWGIVIAFVFWERDVFYIQTFLFMRSFTGSPFSPVMNIVYLVISFLLSQGAMEIDTLTLEDQDNSLVKVIVGMVILLAISAYLLCKICAFLS